jgi:hypothetical protein
MLSPASLQPPTPAEAAALESVSNVVVQHFRKLAEDSAKAGGSSGPVLIQVDGPGRTLFLDRLAGKLDPVVWKRRKAKTAREKADRKMATKDPWAAIEFDAWRHQRVAPPWWWLISALDKQLRRRFWDSDRRRWLRNRSHDLLTRLGKFLKDLLWVLPGVAVVALGVLLSEGGMLDGLEWVAKVGGGIAALLALGTSLANAVRRHLLAESPRGATALLRNSDPMADLRRRYRFLVRSAGTPVIFLIDNLDRCRAEYVVEILEGIQTLFRDDDDDRDGGRLVVFVVAADRGWLCDSYLHVYEEFSDTSVEPGRPFGLSFVDKIFDLELRMPTVPAGTRLTAADGKAARRPNPFKGCESELEVRRKLRLEEGAKHLYDLKVPAPRHDLRTLAVERIGKIELREGDRQCADTSRELWALLEATDPGPSATRQLHAAYCVQRTSQFLAGHEVAVDDDIIRRLGLWTILSLKWPLLAADLAETPEHLEHLRRGAAPRGIPKDLAPAFRLPGARRIAAGVGATTLTPGDIRRFTRPISAHASDEPQAPRFQLSEHVPGTVPVG